MDFNERKFRELVLYIATQCESLPLYGTTKLYKILFYADFSAFKKRHEPITGAGYLAWEHGPVPEERDHIGRDMVQDGDLALRRVGSQHRFVPLREPDLTIFLAEEIAIVDGVIEMFRHETAQSVSDRSHRESLGWQAAFAEHDSTGKQVVIPYGTVFVSNRKLDEFEEQRGLQLAKKYGWPIE